MAVLCFLGLLRGASPAVSSEADYKVGGVGAVLRSLLCLALSCGSRF